MRIQCRRITDLKKIKIWDVQLGDWIFISKTYERFLIHIIYIEYDYSFPVKGKRSFVFTAFLKKSLFKIKAGTGNIIIPHDVLNSYGNLEKVTIVMYIGILQELKVYNLNDDVDHLIIPFKLFKALSDNVSDVWLGTTTYYVDLMLAIMVMSFGKRKEWFLSVT